MLEIFEITRLPGFLLIFARVIGFFVTIPLFSYRNIPIPFKLGLAIFISWIMFYTIGIPFLTFDGNYVLLILKELIVGLFIGFVAYLVIAAVQVAGGFIDFQMGFAIANVSDPQTGAQSPLTGQFLYTITLLFLITVDAHHMLLDGIVYSYELIHLDSFISFGNESLPLFLIKTFSQMFIIAFQIAIPIVGCLFLVDIALGIIARTVPQVNVFVVGLPLKIFVSFVVLLLSLGIYTILIQKLFETMTHAMRDIMVLLGGA